MTKILAIETSCDETAAAVVEDGFNICSNIIASQIDIHRRYGGVFPEVASRQHILAIGTVILDALINARFGWNEVDAVAVTYGPGLAGSLLRLQAGHKKRGVRAAHTATAFFTPAPS